MTINRNKSIFYLLFATLLVLLTTNVILLIKGIAINNISKRHLIFLLLNVLLILVAIILVSVMYKKDRKDYVRSNYITNIIHDCKTPITTINLICQTLDDIDVNSQESLKYYSDIVKTESSKLILMIESVLNFIRLNDVVLEYNQKIDVHQVINDSVNSMKFLLKSLDGDISTSFQSRECCVKGNYEVLLSIIANIINNAIKYSEMSPVIIISTKNIDDNIEISIKDEGIGIEEHEMKKIFDKSYRISSSSGNSNGSGLGLYYVKDNVKKLNGNIEVNSSYGNGSEFRITLPIVK